MKLQSLVESQQVGAALFFKSAYHYTDENGEKGSKPGDVVFTVIFNTQAASDDFIAKCRTKVMTNFINDWIANGSESLIENIVDNKASARIFDVKNIDKLDLHDLGMNHSRASISKNIPAQSLSSTRWRFNFVFDELTHFIHTLSIMSGEPIVKKHFGSEEDLLDTFTL